MAINFIMYFIYLYIISLVLIIIIILSCLLMQYSFWTSSNYNTYLWKIAYSVIFIITVLTLAATILQLQRGNLVIA